jgi:hypothetical protein
MIQDEASTGGIAIDAVRAALTDGVGDAHVGGGVERRLAHDV